MRQQYIINYLLTCHTYTGNLPVPHCYYHAKDISKASRLFIVFRTRLIYTSVKRVAMELIKTQKWMILQSKFFAKIIILQSVNECLSICVKIACVANKRLRREMKEATERWRILHFTFLLYSRSVSKLYWWELLLLTAYIFPLQTCHSFKSKMFLFCCSNLLRMCTRSREHKVDNDVFHGLLHHIPECWLSQ